MIPTGKWSCDTKPREFKDYARPLPEQRFGAVYDVKVGPSDLSVSNGRLDSRNWILYQDGSSVVVRGAVDVATWGSPVVLFEDAEALTNLALSFDNLGRPVVFYRKASGSLILWFYDSQLGEITTKVISATGITPVMDFDIKDDSSSTSADIMLYYVRDDVIYMRLQRDRFDIEYTTGIQFPDLRLEQAGMTEDNRFQVIYTFRDTRDGSMQHRKSLESRTVVMRQMQGHALEVGFRIALAPSHCELRALTKRYGHGWNGKYTVVDHSGTHATVGAPYEERLFTLQFQFADVDDDTNQSIIIALRRTAFAGGEYFIVQSDTFVFDRGDYVLRFTQAEPDGSTPMKRIELIKDGVTIIDRTEVDGESPFGNGPPSSRNRLRFGAATELSYSNPISGGTAAELTLYKDLFPAVFTNIYTIADGVRTDWPKEFSDMVTESVPVGNPMRLIRDGEDTYIFRGGTGAAGAAGTAPKMVVKPAIIGTPVVGNTLSLSSGAFTGDSPISRSYQWRAAGFNIPGATGLTFKITALYTGASIDCVVTATNPAGSVSVTTDNVIVRFAVAPFVLAAPSIGGAAFLGGSMILTQGSFGGDTPMTFANQWRRNGLNIAGATSGVYVVTAADIDQSLDCVVTARNTAGFVTVASNNRIMGDGPPYAITSPYISGAPAVGSVLTVEPGTYFGEMPINVTQQWQRDGVDIEGATGLTYAAQLADRDTSIRCVELVSNVFGTVTSSSNVIRVVGEAPYVITAPSISGATAVGSVLTLTAGVFGGDDPKTYAIQWRRNGAAIAGQTGETYTSVEADVGQSIDCVVTATNATGTMAAVSNNIVMTVGAPRILQYPSISGNLTTGSLIYVTEGTYEGDAPLNVTRQWQRDGVDVPGRTGPTYGILFEDLGTTISCIEFVSNPLGTVAAPSNALRIAGVAPYIILPPVIVGEKTVGSVLVMGTGTYGGGVPQTVTQQWLRNGVPIEGATQTVYTITTEDENTSISVAEYVSNSVGMITATSEQYFIGVIPVYIITPPDIIGQPTVGQTLFLRTGIYGGSEPYTRAIQWLRNGSAIVGQTGEQYALTGVDAGASISATVTMTNPGGSVVATAVAVNVTGTAPFVINPPTISGSNVVGSVLSAGGFAFGGEAPQTVVYQWYRGGTAIDGATAASYMTQSADIGAPVSVWVTSSNGLGSATGVSTSLTIADVAPPPAPDADFTANIGIDDASRIVINRTNNTVTAIASLTFRPDGTTSYTTATMDETNTVFSRVVDDRFINGSNGGDYVLSYSVVWGPDLTDLAPNTLRPLSTTAVVRQVVSSRIDATKQGRYIFKIALASDQSVYATADIVMTAEIYSNVMENDL